MKWTDKELNFLRDNYYVLSSSLMLKKLVGRTWPAIVSKVSYLRKRGWAFLGRYKK